MIISRQKGLQENRINDLAASLSKETSELVLAENNQHQDFNNHFVEIDKSETFIGEITGDESQHSQFGLQSQIGLIGDTSNISAEAEKPSKHTFSVLVSEQVNLEALVQERKHNPRQFSFQMLLNGNGRPGLIETSSEEKDLIPEVTIE